MGREKIMQCEDWIQRKFSFLRAHIVCTESKQPVSYKKKMLSAAATNVLSSESQGEGEEGNTQDNEMTLSQSQTARPKISHTRPKKRSRKKTEEEPDVSQRIITGLVCKK